MPMLKKTSSREPRQLLAAKRGLDAIREYVDAPLPSLDTGKVRRLKTGAKEGCEVLAKFINAEGRREAIARQVQAELKVARR